MSLRVLNPNAEMLNKSAAMHMNINAAKDLQDVLKTNLGPAVSASGEMPRPPGGESERGRAVAMSLRVLNPNAEVLNKSAAMHMNINAAKGLQDMIKTNLGPKDTIKL